MDIKTLYLQEMGCNDDKIPDDIKNHRLFTIDNIDIVFEGDIYRNVSIEFSQGARYNYRATNKITGAPLKKTVKELKNINGLWIRTYYNKDININGNITNVCTGILKLDKIADDENLTYCKRDILKFINRYCLNTYYNKLVLTDHAAADIIKKRGGFREKYILENDHYFKRGMWTDSHKIIYCVKRSNDDTNGARCEVDLVQGLITG